MRGRSTRWKATTFGAAAVAIGLTVGCGDDDSGLDPGGSNIRGNLTSASTNGDTSLGSINVIVRGDRESNGTTDSLGQFLVTNAPTGNISVLLRRGACEAQIPLDAVTSNASLVLQNIAFNCTTATVGRVLETTEAVLRNDPGSALETLETCVRVGDDDQRRDVDADGAAIFDGSSPTDFADLEDNDRIEVAGERAGVGAAGPLLASSVTILDRDVNDPCDDDPLN